MSQFTQPDIALAKRVNEELKTIEGVRDEKDFWGFVKGIPSMIVQDGLLQTLAFLKAKGDEKKKDKYYKVCSAFENYGRDVLGIQQDLITYLVNNSIELEHYLYFEDRFLQFAIWFKRLGLALYADPKAR